MKTIEENNELIAEFMGLYNPKRIAPQPRIKDYSSSWDWLMPVVEKIFSLGYDYTIKPREMYIKERLGFNIVSVTGEGESQEEVVYKAVIEFIKNHNS